VAALGWALVAGLSRSPGSYPGAPVVHPLAPAPGVDDATPVEPSADGLVRVLPRLDTAEVPPGDLAVVLEDASGRLLDRWTVTHGTASPAVVIELGGDLPAGVPLVLVIRSAHPDGATGPAWRFPLVIAR